MQIGRMVQKSTMRPMFCSLTGFLPAGPAPRTGVPPGGQGALYRHTAVDLGAQVVELLLIVGHDPLDPLGVEVVGDLLGGESPEGELRHREGKQAYVVRLKVNLSPVPEDLPIAQQEIPVGQPPLGVAFGRPGVAEVDVDQVHFLRGEKLRQRCRVPVHEKDVVQVHLSGPLHGHDHGVGHPLHSHKEHVGMGGRRLAGEAALATAQFQAQLGGCGHQGAPVPPKALGLSDQPRGAAFHPGHQVLLSSHSH